jgi:ElaB/YqjD/DUF883 family membrane-anchored ribosome-binding protein
VGAGGGRLRAALDGVAPAQAFTCGGTFWRPLRHKDYLFPDQVISLVLIERTTTMNDTVHDMAASKTKLVQDLQRVIADAEELLHATASETEPKLVEMRERIRGNLLAARHKLGDIEDVIKTKTKEAAQATDDYVHEHPWKAIGVAAGAGLIIGLLVGRR